MVDHFEEFTCAMHDKLTANQHKRGTARGRLTAHQMLAFLKIEVAELEAAFDHLGPADVMEELIDIGCFALLMHKKVSEGVV